ncbi:MAG: PilZ domain-containing protein [Terriglobia bacterium]
MEGWLPLAVVREIEGRKLEDERAGAGEARCAQRFILQVPIRYRLAGESTWREGETENISSSGVLFRSEFLPAAGAPLDLCIAMPPLNAEGAAEVICSGIVVRVEPTPGKDSPAVAARILHFRLARR